MEEKKKLFDELVSVQTMSQKIAQVFFLRYLYGSTKGSIIKGSDMLSPWTGAAAYNKYDGEDISDQVIGASGATEYNTFLEFIPVRKSTVVIKVGSSVWKDVPGTGATGEIDITFTSATSEDPEISYTYNLENGPAAAGEVNVKVDESIITARPHKLRALYAFDAELS